MKNDHGFDRDEQLRHQRITARAFARFQARGGAHGSDLEDWLEAEGEEAAAEAEQAAVTATPPPGLAPYSPSGNPKRDEDTRREAERAARAIHRDAQRQLVR